jgi:hypothetical protein
MCGLRSLPLQHWVVAEELAAGFASGIGLIPASTAQRALGFGAYFERTDRTAATIPGREPQVRGMRSEMRMGVFAVGFAACFGGVVACATMRGPAGSQPQVALRRGSAWSTYNLKLPRISGPNANMVLENGRLTGLLASRSLDVKIEEGEANGFGPGGPVNVTITREGEETRVDGMWNGAPVNLRFAPSSVKGSVVVWQGRMVAQQASCGYDLDKVESNGALSGTSTCEGMPQQTLLEVQAATAKVLTPTELAVLLVAALSSPPISPNEATL